MDYKNEVNSGQVFFTELTRQSQDITIPALSGSNEETDYIPAG
jgi:hypothetical protein